MKYMILIALAYLLAACPKAKDPEPKAAEGAAQKVVEDGSVKMDAVVVDVPRVD